MGENSRIFAITSEDHINDNTECTTKFYYSSTTGELIELYLDHNDNKRKGVDHILKKSDGIPIRYIFRFYLKKSKVLNIKN